MHSYFNSNQSDKTYHCIGPLDFLFLPCSFLFRIFIYIPSCRGIFLRAKCLQGEALSGRSLMLFSGYPRIARYAEEIVMCMQFATKKDYFGWYLHLRLCRQQRTLYIAAQTVKQQ